MSIELSEATKYWMALSSVKNIGSKKARMLVGIFGSPEEVISAPVNEIASLPMMNFMLACQIAETGKLLDRFGKFVTAMSKMGIEVLCPDNVEYPRLLKLTHDPPCILYKKGAFSMNDIPTAAIVGTRFPTPDGINAAESISKKLVDKGFAVISGLAKGVDTAAHSGALGAGGRTFAIPGSGLRRIYPEENCQLAENISFSGAVLSECHPNESVSKQRLIQRNRIISGSSLGVFLLEPENGSLNAAQWALKYGRKVFLYDSRKPKPDENCHFLTSRNIYRIHNMDELDDIIELLQKATPSKLIDNGEDQMRLF